ncbi:MAG: ExeM/NucH family extracellular endonuclease [Caldilineaceae bacterium]
MTTPYRTRALALALLLAVCITFLPPGLGGTLPVQAAGSVSLTTLGTAYTQDFNTLASSGTANTTVPVGWEFSESGTNANTTYRAGTGSDNTGDTYSFGANGNSERAFGGLRSGNLVPLIGAQFTNNSGSTIVSLAITYTGEQWRLGQNTTGRAADRLDFQLSTNATSITTGTWTDSDSLDFSSPVVAGTVGALDGNVTPNRTAISFTITGLNIQNGASFWLRWADSDLIPGADDGLSVDDFSLTPQGVVADGAPSVTSTSPTNASVGVALASNVTVTFSEPVNVTDPWFTLICSGSGNRTATVSGGPTTFTIDPVADFFAGESCTLTVNSANVRDQDANDPPDAMAADFSAGFSTFVPDTAPIVTSTSPANGSTDAATASNITITFSEPVNVTDAWYNLVCSLSGTKSAAVSGGPTTFTVNPDNDFTAGDSCTLTVNSANVTDLDTNDPPDAMADNYAFGFTVVDPCTQPYTAIYQIQGSGANAAVTGAVTTQGVVVGDYEGPSPALRGFFIQDPTGDGNAATSDGMFVFEGSNANTVNLGDVVRVTGTASENQGQSQVSVGTILKCGTGSVTPTDVIFPVASADFLEQYEGMLVRLPQTMYVTEHFQLGRFGQVVISADGRLAQPTNVVAPGEPALALQAKNDLRKIILDDGSQVQNPDPIVFARGGQPLSASNTLRGGDTATGIVGVLNYTWAGNAASGNAYRIRPVNALGGSFNFEPTNPRPVNAPAATGSVRVAGMNLLNFFNTFDGLPDNVDNCTVGAGGAPTDCRGADTAAEFDRQWPKTVAGIVGTGADIIGVNEVENDGYGPDSALQFLVDKLNAATAPGTYAFINADALTGQVNALGTDAIKVGMIYKPAKVTPVGQTAALNSVAFVNGGDGSPRARPALVQAFQVNDTGVSFIVAANHFKSKGSACDTPDAGDGQGNCNIVRANGANALAAFLATDPTGTNDPDVLIIGDLNSYAKEDPITALINAGYTNLIERFIGAGAYSYVFDGQWGYLDHALASASLEPQIVGVAEWHINADEPSVLDYNTDFKTAGLQSSLYAPDEFRISDHDPVVVDVNIPPVVGSFSGPSAPTAINTAVQFTAGFIDPTVGDVHTANWTWGDGTSSDGNVLDGAGSGSVTGSHTYATPGVYTVVLTVSDNYAGTSTYTFQYVVVYDPSGGFVTGGGWINSPAGAYSPDPTLTGKANFGFVSKYQKGTTVPAGNTQFQFQTGGLNFESTSYEWLVISGAKAQFKGAGTINGAGTYAFLLTANDGERTGSSDRFRIKIWDKSTGTVVYDNQRNAGDTADPTTALGGGSIVIHDGKGNKAAVVDEPEITNRLFLPGVMR